MDATTERPKFRSMAESTAEDWRRVVDTSTLFAEAFPDRVLAELRRLDGDDAGGFAINRLEHSLQTATRARRAGRDDEYVVCALLHDIGDALCPTNHADLAAAMLKPYVSDQNHWMVAHHTVFQGYYYYHHVGMDRDLRDQYRGHPHFEYTAQFCHLYDQNSLDPDYKSMPLEAFRPVLWRVLERPKREVVFPEEAVVPAKSQSWLRRFLTGKAA